jgi:hypothetical protein
VEIENYYKALRISLSGRGITSTIANLSFLAWIVSIPWAIFRSLKWVYVISLFALAFFFVMVSKKYNKQARSSAMLIVKNVSQLPDELKRIDYNLNLRRATKAEQDMIAEMDALLIEQPEG